MNFKSMPNKEKLELCQKYFIAGFALLPFMWAINAFWFFKEAFLVDEYAEQRKIKLYVIISFIGSLLWLIGLISWSVYFQNHRTEWGELGDSLSFIIPKGSP